ncbi:MAG: hypothetical protein KAI91_08225, partial [Candidatus Omnitrophica bacterium]|nr:hypothetical protein [Candidatus Omnitrophota bacterium]
MEKKYTFERVKEIMLEIADELDNSVSLLKYSEESIENIEKLVKAVIRSGYTGNRVFLDGVGRVREILDMFSARIIQIYNINPRLMRKNVGTKIQEKIDVVIVVSLSGEIKQMIKTIKHNIDVKGIIPFVFTGIGESPLQDLIVKGKKSFKIQEIYRFLKRGKRERTIFIEGKVLGIFVPGNVVRIGKGKVVSYYARQIRKKMPSKRITPTEISSEFILLAIFDAIAAHIMRTLGLTEEDLRHAELEYPAKVGKDYIEKDKPKVELEAFYKNGEVSLNYLSNNRLEQKEEGLLIKGLGLFVEKSGIKENFEISFIFDSAQEKIAYTHIKEKSIYLNSILVRGPPK